MLDTDGCFESGRRAFRHPADQAVMIDLVAAIDDGVGKVCRDIGEILAAA